MTAAVDDDVVDGEVVKVEQAPVTVSEPGVYYDISDRDYHRDCVVGGSLASTGSRTLANKTPAHYAWERAHGRKDKKEFDLGHAFHAWFLSRGADVVLIDAKDWRTQKAKDERDQAYAEGKTPLIIPQVAQVRAMLAAAAKHRVLGRLWRRTDWHPEVTFVGRDPETGVMCRVRVDLLLPMVLDGTPIEFVDLKTCDDASKSGMESSMASWGYDAQLDFYCCVIRWALGLDDDYPVHGSLIAVEKPEPHFIGLGQPDEQALAYAHENNRLARHLYARCTASGRWEGYSEEFVPLSLPSWRIYQHRARYGEDGVFDPDTYFHDDEDLELF